MKALVQFKDGSSQFMDVPFGCRGSYLTTVVAREVLRTTRALTYPTQVTREETITARWVRCDRDAHGQIMHDVFVEA